MLKYRNGIDFCMPILYHANLLNLLITSIFFFCFGWSYCNLLYTRSCHLQQRHFYFFLSDWNLFSFSIILPDCCGRTSSTMLNKSSDSWHPGLDFEFNREVFNISPLSIMLCSPSGASGKESACQLQIMLAVELLYMVFVMLRYIPLIFNAKSFYQERMLYFVKYTLCIYWDNHIILIFHSINVVYCIYWFA